MLTFNLPLKWKKPVKMPSGVFLTQSVAVGGKVYIKGGWAEGSHYKVLEYTVQRSQWREINTPVQIFGMTTINDQLIIIGGIDKESKITDQVWVLDSLSDTWIQPFPQLPEARCWTSAVSYKKWVLVVGGMKSNECSELYALDSASKVWYTASPLPQGATRPSLTVMQDTLYVVYGNTAISKSIIALLSHAVSQHSASDITSNSSTEYKPTAWQTLPHTPTAYPELVTFHGLVLTVGAGNTPSSTIAMYCPQTEQWLKVAELPTPRRLCTCVILPDTEELMVIGGGDGKYFFIKTIDLCTL